MPIWRQAGSPSNWCKSCRRSAGELARARSFSSSTVVASPLLKVIMVGNPSVVNIGHRVKPGGLFNTAWPRVKVNCLRDDRLGRGKSSGNAQLSSEQRDGSEPVTRERSETRTHHECHQR